MAWSFCAWAYSRAVCLLCEERKMVHGFERHCRDRVLCTRCVVRMISTPDSKTPTVCMYLWNGGSPSSVLYRIVHQVLVRCTKLRPSVQPQVGLNTTVSAQHRTGRTHSLIGGPASTAVHVRALEWSLNN